MKHLKTFETLNQKQLELIIIQWMNSNKIEKVDLPEIKELDEYTHQPPVQWILKYICINPNYNKDYYYEQYYIIATRNGEEEEEVCDLTGVWKMSTIQKIWNHLKNLTPEEIENQRAKNEAEKFNF